MQSCDALPSFSGVLDDHEGVERGARAGLGQGRGDRRAEGGAQQHEAPPRAPRVSRLAARALPQDDRGQATGTAGRRTEGFLCQHPREFCVNDSMGGTLAALSFLDLLIAESVRVSKMA